MHAGQFCAMQAHHVMAELATSCDCHACLHRLQDSVQRHPGHCTQEQQLRKCMHAGRGAAAWRRALRAASTSANTSVKLLASSAGRRASRSAASCAVAAAPVSASGTSTARHLLPDPLNPCVTDRLYVHRAGPLASGQKQANTRLYRCCAGVRCVRSAECSTPGAATVHLLSTSDSGSVPCPGLCNECTYTAP